jgi:hypothetical protein
VNWHEPGAEEVAAALHSRGIAVEAGLWTVAAVERWPPFISPPSSRWERQLRLLLGGRPMHRLDAVPSTR